MENKKTSKDLLQAKHNQIEATEIFLICIHASNKLSTSRKFP